MEYNIVLKRIRIEPTATKVEIVLANMVADGYCLAQAYRTDNFHYLYFTPLEID